MNLYKNIKKCNKIFPSMQLMKFYILYISKGNKLRGIKMGLYGMENACRERYPFGAPYCTPRVMRPVHRVPMGCPVPRHSCRIPQPLVMRPVVVTPPPVYNVCGSTGTLLAGFTGFGLGAIFGSLLGKI